jgi:uncharacterized protein YkwD
MFNLFRLAAVAATFAFASPALASCNAPSNSAEIARQVATMTSQFRRQYGLGKVNVSPALMKAATAYACEMAQTGTFGHVGKNGSNVKTRATKAGYGRACMVAENIAWGYKGLDVVMSGWENSPKHKANLTHRKAKDIGIAVAYNGSTPYWVMMLASKC